MWRSTLVIVFLTGVPMLPLPRSSYKRTALLVLTTPGSRPRRTGSIADDLLVPALFSAWLGAAVVAGGCVAQIAVNRHEPTISELLQALSRCS